MKSSTALFIVTAASVSSTLAAPTAVQKTSFAETCTNIRLQWVQKWVTADCLTGNGDERLTSTVYLATKIQDHSAWSSDAIDLKWSYLQGQANDWQFCSECTIVGANLTCQCLHKNVPYESNPSSIDLGEHIFNYAGHLLSNLPAEPSSIPAASDFPIPVGDDSRDAQWNINVASSPDCQIYLDNNGHTIGPGFQAGTTGPSACKSFHDTPYLMLWEAFPNYNIIVFNTTDCQDGTEIFRFGDNRVCHGINEIPGYVPTGGFKAVPKFNWG